MSDAVGEKLSIVVLNHNGGATLRACLDSLRAKTRHRDWELVVVDTGSTDGSLEPIRGRRDVRILEERERHVPRALNRAFATCGDNDVVRVDCRVVVQTDDWLEQLLETARDQPQAGVVGAKLVFPDDRIDSVGRNIVTGLGIADRHANLSRFENDPGTGGEPREVDSVSGALAFYRREVLETTGGLDEGFWPEYLEDDDFCMMARHAGYKVYVCQSVTAVHYAPAWSPTTRLCLKDPAGLVEKAIEMQRVVSESHAGYWLRKWGWDPRFPDLAEIRRLYGDTEICWRIGEPMRYRPSSDQPPVDVVLVTWNCQAALKRCLDSLAATRYPDIRVHVTDNGSTDGTVRYLEELAEHYPFPLQVYTLPINTGVATGFNWSIVYGEAELVARIDDDVVLPPDWLEKLVECLIRRPFAGVVGPKILNDDVHRSIQCAAFRLYPGMFAHEGEPDVGQADYIARTAHVRGCCNLYRREVFDRCGLFDLRFSPSQWDDPDHHVAVCAQGYEAIYDGRVGVVHALATGKGRTWAAVTNQAANADKFLGKWGTDVWSILDRALDGSREGRFLPADFDLSRFHATLPSPADFPRRHVPEIPPDEHRTRTSALRYRELAFQTDGPLSDYWLDTLQAAVDLRTAHSTGRAALVLHSLLDLMPHWARVMAELAATYQTMGQPDRAATFLDRALTLAPDDPQIREFCTRRLPAPSKGAVHRDPADRSDEIGQRVSSGVHRVERSAAKLRVLMVNTYQARLAGGDMLQIAKTKEYLEALGLYVDVSYRANPDPAGYDVVHLFNLWLANQTLPQVKGLRVRAPEIPIVLTPIYWDMSEKSWAERAVPRIFETANDEEELQDLLSQLAAGTLTMDGLTRRQAPEPMFNGYRDYQHGIIQHADHLLPNSMIELEKLREDFATTLPATVVHNGVEHRIFAEATEDWFVQEYGIRDFVLTVGLVEPRKNQLMLLQAMRDTGLKVVVVGRNYDREYMRLCRQYAPANTIFIEHLPHEKLASAMKAARVFALPSWMECAAFVNIEAAVAGCGLALSNRTSEREYFGEGAYYCDPADVGSIRQAVMFAHRNHEFDQQNRFEVQRRCVEEFTWSRVAEQTLAAYEAALAARSELEPA